MNDIVMPKLSDTMTEGRIVAWKKQVGEQVRRGDVIAEVETDKANMELEAFSDGALLEIKVDAGEMAQVGTVIAVIGRPEERGGQEPAAAGTAEEGAPEREQETTGTAEGGAEEGAQQQAPSGGAAKEAAPKPREAAKEEAPKAREAAKEEAPKAREAAKVEAPQPAQGPESASGVEPAAKEPPLERAMEQGGFQALEPGAVPGEKRATEPSAPAPAEAVPSAAPSAAGAPGEPREVHERAAPVVRRKAREFGIDLSQVKGSGPDGRILLQDLERHPGAQGEAAPSELRPEAPTGPSEPRPEAPSAPPAQRAAAATGGTGGQRPLSRLRSAVAKTVSESWDSIPHFSVTMDIVMDNADSIRRQLKENGMAVTVNDMIVKAAALALEEFPNLNAAFTPNGIQFHDQINISVAVGVPDGVLMPVIQGCQRHSLLEIAKAGRGLVEKARSGSLSEQEMGGGTFAVSNLGMLGVTQFTAIIYPSQGAVLAVGAVIDTVVARCGVPIVAKVMKVTLCADHRVTDGAYAAGFLVRLKQILENPALLLVKNPD